MVFAKNNDDTLASLVKKLDAAIEEHKKAKLAVVVHLMGEDRDELLETAKEFETKGIPVTVPVENEAGPENWSINPEADLTVFTYKGKKIKKSHGFKDVSEEDIEKVLASVKEVVN